MEDEKEGFRIVQNYMSETDCESLFADGFEEAVIGIVERFNSEPLVLYDKEKCLDILVSQNMTRDEALEFFEYNVIGAWVGEGTPCFATLAKDIFP